MLWGATRAAPWQANAGQVTYFNSVEPSLAHWLMQAHHDNMRALIALAVEAADQSRGVIVEGSALRPAQKEALAAP